MDCKTCTHKDLQSFSETCVECGIDMKNYKPITNADRIRAMSDEELAKQFNDVRASFKCVICGDGKRCLAFDECEDCWLDWMKQEVK